MDATPEGVQEAAVEVARALAAFPRAFSLTLRIRDPWSEEDDDPERRRAAQEGQALSFVAGAGPVKIELGPVVESIAASPAAGPLGELRELVFHTVSAFNRDWYKAWPTLRQVAAEALAASRVQHVQLTSVNPRTDTLAIQLAFYVKQVRTGHDGLSSPAGAVL